MEEIKAITVYETSDGQRFDTKDQAIRHEEDKGLSKTLYTLFDFLNYEDSLELAIWINSKYTESK